jgi:hypothetical protein
MNTRGCLFALFSLRSIPKEETLVSAYLDKNIFSQQLFSICKNEWERGVNNGIILSAIIKLLEAIKILRLTWSTSHFSFSLVLYSFHSPKEFISRSGNIFLCIALIFRINFGEFVSVFLTSTSFQNVLILWKSSKWFLSNKCEFDGYVLLVSYFWKNTEIWRIQKKFR